MTGPIALVGGDEFLPGCEVMDSYILESTGKSQPELLVVPTAAVTAPEKAATNGVNHFNGLGARSRKLMVLDRTDANDHELIQKVYTVSVVYFTGGSPDHLLATLRGSKLLDIIEEQLNNGMLVLAGSSAGAMVMGSLMRQPSSHVWVDGLGILKDLAVLPHHEGSDPGTIAHELKDTAPPGLTVLGIDSKTCCLGRPGAWKVRGPGNVTVYKDGLWASFSSGSSLPPGF